MQNFRFVVPTEIIFGKDVQHEVGMETKKHADKVLLHYGGGHIKKSGLYDEVIASLKSAGVEYVELGGVAPNPRLEMVREGIEACRREGIRFILAVGGGSVIDSAKAIASGVDYDGDVWDLFTKDGEIDSALAIGVVLTIPAAGSECSNSCVITDWENNNKRHFGDNRLRPVFACMNPELTYTLPPYQTACGATDIMAHIMERYFTDTKDVEFTDRMCEAALKTIISNAPKVLENPEDYAARAEIMWAGTIAHNDLLSTGREGDWASHMIEHELSGINDVAHGAGLAVVFPALLKYRCEKDLERFVQFAVRVWNVEQDHFNPEKTALEGIARLKAFFQSIGLPTSLKEIELGEEHFDRIVQNVRRFDGETVGGVSHLTSEELIEVLKIAL